MPLSAGDKTARHFPPEGKVKMTFSSGEGGNRLRRLTEEAFFLCVIPTKRKRVEGSQREKTVAGGISQSLSLLRNDRIKERDFSLSLEMTGGRKARKVVNPLSRRRWRRQLPL